MRVDGVIRPPGDKSITHRALMLAACAEGESVLRHVLTSDDARATAAALRRLGSAVSSLRSGATVHVRGRRWKAPGRTIDCGNSGTTARLLLGFLAGHGFTARLTGDASLRRRPMRRVTEPLSRMGARIAEENGDCLPLRITGGRLTPLVYRQPVASAQVKSALLFAGLVSGVEVRVTEPTRSRDHTERLLEHLGLALTRHRGTVVLASGARRVKGFELDIPGDASSAAFLVAAAVLAEGGALVVESVGINPTRTGFLRVLDRMGAAVGVENRRTVGGEPVGDLVARPASLSGAAVTGREVPSLIDEVPILAVLAARARGESRFESVGELRVKESDRLALLARNLRAVGVRAEAEGEALYVEGTERPPVGRVDTAGDHRLVMAFAVLGTVPGARIELSERASAAVSFPGFFDALARIRA